MLRRLAKDAVGVAFRRRCLLETLSICASPTEPQSTVRSSPTRSVRWSSSLPVKDSDFDDSEVKRLEGARLLRSLNAYSFREHLKDLGEQRTRISFKELIDLARQRGAAATPQESRALCEALVAAGVLFRYGDVVYLRTDEVAEMVLTCLPDSEKGFQKRVEALQAELVPLEKQKQFIEEEASKWSTYVLWGGLSFLVLQFGVFVRLTFWELSWDVMEPVSYFVSLAYGIAFYLYFLVSNENFEFHHVRDRLKSYFTKQRESTFDSQKYERLTRKLSRCRKYLAKCRV